MRLGMAATKKTETQRTKKENVSATIHRWVPRRIPLLLAVPSQYNIAKLTNLQFGRAMRAAHTSSSLAFICFSAFHFVGEFPLREEVIRFALLCTSLHYSSIFICTQWRKRKDAPTNDADHYEFRTHLSCHTQLPKRTCSHLFDAHYILVEHKHIARSLSQTNSRVLCISFFEKKKKKRYAPRALKLI